MTDASLSQSMEKCLIGPSDGMPDFDGEKNVYVYLEPRAGLRDSTTIVSFYFTEDKNICICGMDSEKNKNIEEFMEDDELIRSHITGLVELFDGKNVKFISLISKIMSCVIAHRFAKIMDAQNPMLHGSSGDIINSIGVCTTMRTQEWVMDMIPDMIENDKIVVLPNLVCAGERDGLTGAEKIKSVVDQLLDETDPCLSGIQSVDTELACNTFIGIHWGCEHHISHNLRTIKL